MDSTRSLHPMAKAWLLDGPLSQYVDAFEALLERGRYAAGTVATDLLQIGQIDWSKQQVARRCAAARVITETERITECGRSITDVRVQIPIVASESQRILAQEPMKGGGYKIYFDNRICQSRRSLGS